jgi:hypothetical protein
MSLMLPAYRLGQLIAGQREGVDTTEKDCFRGATNPSLVPSNIPLLPHVQCHITDYYQLQELTLGQEYEWPTGRGNMEKPGRHETFPRSRYFQKTRFSG